MSKTEPLMRTREARPRNEDHKINYTWYLALINETREISEMGLREL